MIDGLLLGPWTLRPLEWSMELDYWVADFHVIDNKGRLAPHIRGRSEIEVVIYSPL